MARILVVDDELKLSKLISEMLELDGHEVVRANGGRTALVELAARPLDLVITDLRMPEVDGLSVLREARARPDPPDVVMMTAHGTAESAVEAMKQGAADYLLKPFAIEELRIRIRRLAEQRAAGRSNRTLVERLTPGMIADSARMKAALESARRVAGTDTTVLLLGESGTGKTHLARFVHFASSRAQGPLIEVHCAALPEALLEAELFGHEKGAFTGAHEKREGHLAAAHKGTLFLDEIGEIASATQVKLLRFLQDKQFVPVGSTEPRKVDVRVIAATNRDLSAAVREGQFREDFYYRLNVFSIEVPPLRERSEDMEPLAEAFLRARGVPGSRLTDGARDQLRRRDWPGNVRELENALERALVLAGDESINAEHVAAPGGAARATPVADLLVPGFSIDDFERELIFAAIERAGGNKAAAARLLGITRRRLYSMLQSHGREEPGDAADQT
jgi:DNA-binding NtrC family response regulator